MTKIDIDKFVCSLLQNANEQGDGILMEVIYSSLNDQGLEYKGGEIVSMASPAQVGFEELSKIWDEEKINPSEFDKQLNALLKEFESLPKKEIASILDFYLKAVIHETPFNLMRLKEVAKPETEEEKSMTIRIPEDLKGTDQDGGVKGEKGEQGLTEFEQALVDAYMSNTPIIQKADELLNIAKRQLEANPEFLYTVTRRAAARERKETIEKACKIIDAFLDIVRKDIAYTNKEFIKDFKEAKKEQQ